MKQNAATTLDTDYPGEEEEAYEGALDFEPEEGEAKKGDAWLIANANQINLCHAIEDSDLARIGVKVVEEYKIDDESRKSSGWMERHNAALKMAMQVKEAKNYPWPKASNVKYPLITVAAIQFAARAYPAIVDGSNIVKGKVLGKPDEEKRKRADRIGRHMSYQLLDEMVEWEEETDELLHILPVTGTVFRKTYFDPAKGRNCSELITADKLVVNYWSKRDPERMTQVCEYTPREIAGKMRSGLWTQCDLGKPANAGDDDDAPHKFLEQHRLLDLDDDGYPEPYIVTVHLETQKVVRIYARYDEDGIKANDKGEVYSITPVHYFTRYRFMPALDGSYYGVGFGTLLEPMNETINSTINQLMDAGHLANTQGGFIGSGVSMKSGSLRFAPGEWKRVENTSGASLAQNIVPLTVQQPSTVLFQLLGMLIEASKDITATKDILTGDTNQANTPVGTTLALIEQGLKVATAIFKRVHRALKDELACLFRLNKLYLNPEVYFEFQDEGNKVSLDDYRVADVGVVPVSDPSVMTDMQRLGRAQYLMQFRGMGFDDQKIAERAMEAGGITDIDELKPKGPPPIQPEVQAEMKKAEQKDRELDQKDIELSQKDKVAETQAMSNAANAQKTMTEALLAAPQFQLQVQQFLEQALNSAIQHAVSALPPPMPQQGAPNGLAAPVQPGDVQGMGQPPVDGGVPELPSGPPGIPGEGMDGGSELAPGGAVPGDLSGGADGPGVG